MSGADFPDDFLAASMAFPNARKTKRAASNAAAIKAM